jgi:hypothetical protein
MTDTVPRIARRSESQALALSAVAQAAARGRVGRRTVRGRSAEVGKPPLEKRVSLEDADIASSLRCAREEWSR